MWFEIVIEWINMVCLDVDLVVIVSDLVDWGCFVVFYEVFKDVLKKLFMCYVLMFGNYDDCDIFCSVFGNMYCDENGYV